MKDLPAILGGDKVREKPFPRRITMGDEEKKAVQEVMDSDVLSAFFGSPGELFLGGPKIKEFENNWARDFGFKYAISVNSWTSGLMIALGSVGIEPGDEGSCSTRNICFALIIPSIRIGLEPAAPLATVYSIPFQSGYTLGLIPNKSVVSVITLSIPTNSLLVAKVEPDIP